MLILLATIYYIIQNKAWSLAPEKTNKAKSSSIAWNNRVVERKWREKEQKKKVNKKKRWQWWSVLEKDKYLV